ncbi:HK97 gp10 family phage protein [Paenibacillus sp. FSL R7-0312]|uniref:HK97 gp10 family phage protein n=1 Tax=Paenibacillus sp. FSL R7-0312 TaxID=2921682 RepID=UPI0030F9D528
MADNGAFSFELDGLDKIIDRLDDLEKDIEIRLDATLTKLAMKIIHDAKRLAPNDIGDLEGALEVGELVQLIGLSSIDFGATVDVNDYSVIQHEGFNKSSLGKVITLKPGEKTLSKGNYRGYMPGKKYLANAIKLNEKLIKSELSKILEGW